ncbi:hypothetical protein DY000_02030529 [Brassica cretica]|uniref:Secreted protein n=1 Tax=Brassica cretica TaxID=69181 RepID=A0ABQ7E0A5_BRACR|nr:hypothetical protein DY000_02030529 [Brassica cretica]
MDCSPFSVYPMTCCITQMTLLVMQVMQDSMFGLEYRLTSDRRYRSTEECLRSTVMSECRSTRLVSRSTVVDENRATN